MTKKVFSLFLILFFLSENNFAQSCNSNEIVDISQIWETNASTWTNGTLTKTFQDFGGYDLDVTINFLDYSSLGAVEEGPMYTAKPSNWSKDFNIINSRIRGTLSQDITINFSAPVNDFRMAIVDIDAASFTDVVEITSDKGNPTITGYKNSPSFSISGNVVSGDSPNSNDDDGTAILDFPDQTENITIKWTDNQSNSSVRSIGISFIQMNSEGLGNYPPVAVNDTISCDEGDIVGFNVATNDSDPENDNLTFEQITLPSHGTVNFNNDNGDAIYTNDGDEFISDSFKYIVKDGLCVDTAEVIIQVIPKNDRPIVVKDTFYVNEGDTLLVLNNDPKLIINNDIDLDNTVEDFFAELAIPPQHTPAGSTFSVDFGNRGAFKYIHGCNGATFDVFQYYVNDGIQSSERADSVIIFIQNEAPFGEPDFYSVETNGSLIIDDELDGVLSNDIDSFICDTLRVELISPPSMHAGTFSLDSNGTFTYVHSGALDSSEDFFVYQLSDGQDNALETDTVYISIQTAGPSTESLNFAVDEGKQLVVDSIESIFTVVSSNLGLDLTVELFQPPSRGTLLPSGEINDDGSFVYEHDCTDTPNQDYFLYKVKDSLTESIDTVFITINNICPVGENDFYKISEGQTIDISSDLGVLSNDTDDNSCDQLTATLLLPPLYHSGSFVLNDDGSFIYTHDDSENFEDQFSYRLSDGECIGNVYTVILGIDSVSDSPPTARNNNIFPCVKEGETLIVSNYDDGVLGNDSDPDPKDSILSAILIENVSHGVLSFNDDGTFTYTHDGGEDETDFFSYVAYDGDFYSVDTALVTICIDQVNDCPDAVDDLFTINEGQTLDSTVAKNDIDDDVLSIDNIYTVSSPPSVGSLEMRSDGSFVYIPPSQVDPPGPEVVTFEYEITDPDPSTNCSDKATVTIRINSINDCPIAVDDTIFVDALNNDLIIKDIIANDIDPDNPFDSSSIFILDQPLYGDLTVNDDGTITYDYIGSPSKKDSITYAVQDSLGCISNFAKILINIENIQYPEYELPSYFTPNSDRFNDFFTVKYKNIIPGNVRFEVKIMDRYQRIVFQGDVYNDTIWDGIDQKTSGEAKKGIYYYEITPIEYGDVRARTIVGVIFLDR